MLEKLVLTLALPLLIVGCGCREEAASSGEADPRAAPAKRWRPEPPAQAPPQEVQEQAENDPAGREDEPVDDRREPAADDPREPATSPSAKPTEDPTGGDEAAISNQGPGIITLSTNDCDAWPSYDWPLEMKIEVLEVPERITKPAPPIPDD
ncbi:MAG TPA: hypothetical protein VMY37_19155 [Thermoguttaceae bacterium]|nr:hypothetical protein [Thermoguttaceae bacterium]